MSHRDRLRELVQLLDECPFDVDELREQLGAIHLMVNDDAADVIRQTVHQLDEVKLTLSLTDWTELSEDEAEEHLEALAWLSEACSKLVPYVRN